MKIKSLQTGGGIVSVYTPAPLPAQAYPNLQTAGSGASSSSGKETEADKVNRATFKDLTELINKGKLLPSDLLKVNRVLQQLFTTTGYGNLTSAKVQQAYQQILSLTLKGIADYDEFMKVEKSAETNNSLNEYAVLDGYAYVQDKEGNIKRMSIDKVFGKKQKTYTPLTNEQLLTLRREHPGMAYNNDIIRSVKTSIGIDKVNTKIQGILDKTSTDSLKLSGYTAALAGNILSGLEYLQSLSSGALSLAAKAMSQDGIYKITSNTETNLRQIKLALAYIKSMLGREDLDTLAVHAKGSKNIDTLLGLMASSRTSFKTETDVNWLAEYNADGSKKAEKTEAEKGNIDNLDANPASLFMRGLGEELLFNIVNGTSHGLTQTGISLPITEKGQNIGVTTGDKLMSSDLGSVGDFSQVSAAGQFINTANMKNIVINDGRAYRMFLPIDMATFNRTGKKKPDYSFLPKMELAEQLIKARHATTAALKNAIYAQLGIPVKVDDNGNCISNTAALFMVVNATVGEKALPQGAQLSNYVEEVDDNARKAYADTIGDKDFQMSSWWGLGHGDHVYNTTLFVPMNDSFFNAYASSGLNLKQATNMALRQAEVNHPQQGHQVKLQGLY